LRLLEGESKMALVTLYAPQQSFEYQDATKISRKDGVLTFRVRASADAMKAREIETTLPYIIERTVDTTHD
jgi:hypothetical protein